MITITVDTRGIEKMLADFPARLAAAQRRALQAIGAAVASRTTQAFRTPAFRPSPWAPRKDKKSTHPLLIKSGNLRQSINWKLDGDDAVAVGAPMKYASYHQEGTKNMPARPFFPIDGDGNLTPAMAEKISNTVERIYVDELEKLGG